MRHAFIDAHSDLNTPVHNFSAEGKIILFIVFLLVIVLTPIRHPAAFSVYALIILTLLFLSRTPLRFILTRISHVLPFILIICLSLLFRKQGYILFLNCALKSLLAVLLVLVIFSTTKFSDLLAALKILKAPKLLNDLLSFMYRYVFLIEDQLLRASRAYESRALNQGNYGKIKILSHIIASLFIRSFERAERVYMAMCARGFDNEKDNRDKQLKF